MCVCHMCIKVPTYLLTYDSVKGVQPMYIACILCYTFKLFFVFLSVASN